MMIRVLAAAIIFVFAFSNANSAGTDEEFSEAETVLWLTDQLKTISQPSTLKYQFNRGGSFEPAFEDIVVFNINEVLADGMKAASVDFFTGARRFEVPPVDRTNVNPVLKIYLQGDVYEMNRLTDPDGESRERWRYFQRRIKFALADTATIADVEVTFDGETYAAREVRFAPYKNDPKRSLFEKFADKTYVVTIAEDLPGYLYRIETIIPGATPEDPPLISETLELVTIEAK